MTDSRVHRRSARSDAEQSASPAWKGKTGFQLPPDVSFEKQRLSDAWVYVFRHRVLGELGRILLQELDDGRCHISCEVVGDPSDPMTRQRTAIFKPLGLELTRPDGSGFWHNSGRRGTGRSAAAPSGSQGSIVTPFYFCKFFQRPSRNQWEIPEGRGEGNEGSSAFHFPTSSCGSAARAAVSSLDLSEKHFAADPDKPRFSPFSKEGQSAAELDNLFFGVFAITIRLDQGYGFF